MNWFRLAILALITAAAHPPASAQAQMGAFPPSNGHPVEGCPAEATLTTYGGVSYECNSADLSDQNGSSSASVGNDTHMTATALDYAAASAYLYYTVTVVGPAGEVPIDIHATGNLNGWSASTNLQVEQGESDQFLNEYDGCGLNVCSRESWIYDTAAVAEANIPISVSMEVTASGIAGLPSGGYGYGGSVADEDPTITIDPSFAGASGYTLVFTEGVTQGASVVPEMTAPWLMLVGLSCLIWHAGVVRRPSRSVGSLPSN